MTRADAGLVKGGVTVAVFPQVEPQVGGTGAVGGRIVTGF
jgi:hypothetical protein